jgi:hypothetical protein
MVAPNSGSICPQVGLQCEYGVNPDIRCNQVAICRATGWTYVVGTKCPITQCPLAYDDISAGTHCPIPTENCAYPKGTCVCASAANGSGGNNWTCFQATGACKSPRSDLGLSCTDEGRICDYGNCIGGIALQCTNGLWQEENVACPSN